MNCDLGDVNGGLLVVSQFTLYASTGRTRPSFIKAARPEKAIPMYEDFIAKCEELSGKKVKLESLGQ